MQSFCRFLLKLFGWKAVSPVMPHKKAIIIGVPHTSAWDFVISWIYYTSMGGLAHVVIKKEFFFWPVGWFLRKAGCIPVDRSKGAPIVRQIIDAMNKTDGVFHLAMTPEGTREKTTKWKAGFHTIAKATGATVYLGYFDFGKKEIGWYETFELTDSAQEDIKRMKAFYRTTSIKGKYPDQTTFDD